MHDHAMVKCIFFGFCHGKERQSDEQENQKLGRYRDRQLRAGHLQTPKDSSPTKTLSDLTNAVFRLRGDQVTQFKSDKKFGKVDVLSRVKNPLVRCITDTKD